MNCAGPSRGVQDYSINGIIENSSTMLRDESQVLNLILTIRLDPQKSCPSYLYQQFNQKMQSISDNNSASSNVEWMFDGSDRNTTKYPK
uniref:Uncharacterized protein n=1 Tax=Peronospora matthiolae TaxID=2874970 RepID=A0AAV1UNE7_9STRA